MESTNYQLRLSDFKKMVRYIVSYVIINLAAFVTMIFLLEEDVIGKRDIPLEVFLIGFFLFFTAGFIVVQKKNETVEDIVIDAQGVHTNRFGSLLFSEMTAFQVFKKKRREDIILVLRDNRKIAFGPVNFSKSADKEIYRQFKETVSTKVPKKGYKL
jgi:hypothetical protein